LFIEQETKIVILFEWIFEKMQKSKKG